jgi:hypothetical protein
MLNANEFPARGKVIRAEGDVIVFQPVGTNYEMHLKPKGGSFSGPVGSRIEGIIRTSARKVMTVPSGGNFVAPIFGPPRIVQGRVRTLDERTLIIQAGCPIVVEMPSEDNAIDLNNGAIEAGALVNAMILPGATFELISQPAVTAAKVG